ncbi:MAG TPA: ABC transporter ATP-binding protein [Caproiciproducens sp.]|nr:ABC transporter ATP-binding protein [Caproiciproducens sp.]
MNTDPAVFQLQNAVFAYPAENPVLNSISLSIRKGERVSVLGANGSGKSTLLKIFAGLLLPQQGAFTAFGRQVSEKMRADDAYSMEYHRRVGFIFQDSDVQLFCGTVEEEISFGPLQLNLSADDVKRRTDDIAEMLGIQSLLQKPPFRLSGGEKKKVALASVLVLNPEVLILDEPTNELDPRTQTWLIRLLEALSRAGKTIISSTHNLGLVPRLSQRAVLLSEDHRILADRSAPELLRDFAVLQKANLIDDDIPDFV